MLSDRKLNASLAAAGVDPVEFRRRLAEPSALKLTLSMWQFASVAAGDTRRAAAFSGLLSHAESAVAFWDDRPIAFRDSSGLIWRSR